MIKNDFPWQLSFRQGEWSWKNLSDNEFPFQEDDLKDQKIVRAEKREFLGYIPYHRKNTQFGIIDPDGNFYGCRSGQHMDMMAYIMEQNPQWDNPIQIDAGALGFFRIYKSSVEEFSGTSYRDHMMTPDQSAMLERLGFDRSSGRRTSIPEYDDVFNEQNPAFPQPSLNYRVVSDRSEVLAWMEEVEAKAQSILQFMI